MNSSWIDEIQEEFEMKFQIKVKVPHKKIRAIELYGEGTPFRHRVERDRTKYDRKRDKREASW